MTPADSPLDHVLDPLLTGPLIAPGGHVVGYIETNCDSIETELNRFKLLTVTLPRGWFVVF